MSTLVLAKTLWGVDEAATPAQWPQLFARIAAEGFTAVEASRPVFLGGDLKKELDRHNLQLICQIHTTGGWVDDNGQYQYLTSNKMEDHLASFAKQAQEAKEAGAVLINSHSGHDSWSTEDAVKFFKAALEVEASLGVPIAHETHRQRLLFSPYSCRDVLKSPGMEALKITADLSHWCCVCEHVFDPSDPRDDWWPEVLALVAKHTTLIHARVGYDEGPQVSDPSAPEYKGQVASHMAWWKAIWASQKARGFTEFFAEPEFGPAPYQQMLPHTAVPTTDLWAVNGHVADLLKAEFPY